jgi:hypothetical protein
MYALAVAAKVYRFADNVPDQDGGAGDKAGERFVASRELFYRIELWTETGSSVERVLAMTQHITIGCAALDAAARDYPDREITLSDAQRIVFVRGSGPR